MKIFPFLICSISLVSACSQQTADQLQEGFSNTPAMIVAAETGDLPTIRKLIDDNGQVDIQDACMWTPLMKAALNGHLGIAQRLIDAGADVNQVDKGGYSATMLAASNNHYEIVELLLTHGSKIDQIEVTGGWTALIWAAKLGHIESVRTLLAHQANRDIRDFSNLTALDWATKNQHSEISEMVESSQLSH
ncbi:MAG: ankyrin repeat domain-containing protein [Candidatus Thiodiazotropha sp. 6PLUC2]